MSQPPAPIQPSVNPGYASRFINDPLIGGGQIQATVLPAASTVAPGTATYDPVLGPMYSNGVAYVAGSPNRKLITKMRAALAQAAISNPITAQPLIAPAAWVTATVYVKGMSVINAGNVYACLIGGTSAAAPTLTTNVPIVDGGVTWYYMGPSFASAANAPTYSNVLAASKYTGNFWSNTANNRADGSAQIRDTTNFLITGSLVAETGTNNSVAQLFSGLQGSTLMSISFMIDAPSFQIVHGNLGSSSAAIYVNGVPLSTAGGIGSSNGQSVNYAQLVFATRTPRLITIEGLVQFHGVLVNDTTSKVWAPAFTNSVRLGIVGTSYLSGSALGPVMSPLGLGPQIGKLIGCLDCWTDGDGAGTGYVTTGGSNGNYLTRLPSLVAYAPEMVIITGGGINDRQVGITAANEQAAVVTYLTALRAALPNALIIVVGSEAGASGPNSSVTPPLGAFQMEAACLAGVQQFADPNTFFLPQSNTVAAKAWLSGTGTTAAPNNTGSSDNYVGVDGIHPNQAGFAYLAQQHAVAISGLMNSLIV